MRRIILFGVLALMLLVAGCDSISTGKVTTNKCSTDKDCGSNEFCNEKSNCASKVDERSRSIECATSNDCESDEICVFSLKDYGKCVKKVQWVSKHDFELN